MSSRAGVVDDDARTPKLVDRLPVEVLGVLSIGEQRARAGLDAARPFGVAQRRTFGQLIERCSGDGEIAVARGRLDELRKHPYVESQPIGVVGTLCRGDRVGVFALADVKRCRCPLRGFDCEPLAARVASGMIAARS